MKIIQKNISFKEDALQKQQQQHTKLVSYLKNQEYSINKSVRVLRHTQNTLKKLKSDIDHLALSIHQLHAYKTKHKQLLALQLNITFRKESDAKSKLIFNNQDNLYNKRMLIYLWYFNAERSKKINNLHHAKSYLEERKHSLEKKKYEQKLFLQLQRKQQIILERNRNNRKKALENLNLSIVENKKCLEKLYQNEIQLRNTVTSVKQKNITKNLNNNDMSTRNKDHLITYTGGLGRPERRKCWPVQGCTVHSFGEPQQGELYYKGLVISAKEGSEISSIASGRVIMADWLQGYGLMIVIDHGKGDMSLYGYTKNALVNVGEKVRSGQPIALVGTNNNEKISSLYFEIRRQGQAINPILWLR
nr:peptidoglycan DD-metalloendopeptidase family protein [secondary endosymbiont of Heteropsylla cubana]